MNVYNSPLHFTLKDIIEHFVIKDYNKYPNNFPYILILPNKIARNICIEILSNLKLENNITAVAISDNKTLLKILKKYSDNKYIKDINLLINTQIFNTHKITSLITNLIKHSKYKLSWDEIFNLSKELAILLDIINAENIDINKIKQLPINSHYGEMLIKLLSTISEHWHNIKKEMNYYSILDFKSKVFNLLATIVNSTNNIKIVTFGIDNYSSSISNFLNTIAHHKNGTVIIKGIDYNLSKNDWEALLPTHPQYINTQILKKLDINREEIPNIIVQNKQSSVIFFTQILNSIFNIFPHKFNFNTATNNINNSDIIENVHLKELVNTTNTCNYFNNVAYSELNDEAEEANIIAHVVKKKLQENPKHKISIVTTNFDLSNRISFLLNKEKINHYNSLGNKLNYTENASFFRLITTIDINNIDFVNLLALLKHKLCKFSQNKILIHLIDLYIARESLPNKTLLECSEFLTQCFKHKKITEEECSNIQIIINSIEEIYRSFSSLNKDSIIVKDILNIHIQLAENLSIKNNNNDPLLWSSISGSALRDVLKQISIDIEHLPKMNLQNYNDLLNSLLNEYNLPTNLDKTVNVQITGILQARFTTNNIIFLADLNESSFPVFNTKENPFISYILKQLGLPTSDIDIGKQAFIFMELCHCKQVYLTRSIKKQGNLTTPSRFLVKLQNFLKANNLNFNNEDVDIVMSNINQLTKERINEALNNINIKADVLPIANPKVKYRPKQIKVTAIERLLKNPYIFFIENVLNLNILQPINVDFNSRLRGILIHEILDSYFKCIQQNQYKYEPNNLEEKLLKKVKEKFIPYIKSYPKSKLAYYILKYFSPILAKELYILNKEYTYINSEINKSLKINFDEGSILIYGRADYVAISTEKILIIDFKSGNTPYNKIDIETFRKQLIVLGYLVLKTNTEEKSNYKQLDLAYYFIPSNFHDKLNFVSLKKILSIKELNNYIYEDFENIKSTLKNFLLSKKEFIFNSQHKELSIEYKHFSRIDS